MSDTVMFVVTTPIATVAAFVCYIVAVSQRSCIRPDPAAWLLRLTCAMVILASVIAPMSTVRAIPDAPTWMHWSAFIPLAAVLLPMLVHLGTSVWDRLADASVPLVDDACAAGWYGAEQHQIHRNRARDRWRTSWHLVHPESDAVLIVETSVVRRRMLDHATYGRNEVDVGIWAWTPGAVIALAIQRPDSIDAALTIPSTTKIPQMPASS